MSKLNDTVRDGIILSGVDAVQMRKVPPLNDWVSNVIASGAYDMFLEDIGKRISSTYFPNMQRESGFLMKVVGFSIGLWVGDKVMGSVSKSNKKYLMKGLIGAGASEATRGLI